MAPTTLNRPGFPEAGSSGQMSRTIGRLIAGTGIAAKSSITSSVCRWIQQQIVVIEHALRRLALYNRG
jgi:hypothetical protein